MGPSTIMQITAANRFRDDYGALSSSMTLISGVVTRSLPEQQFACIAAVGGLINAD